MSAEMEWVHRCDGCGAVLADMVGVDPANLAPGPEVCEACFEGREDGEPAAEEG